MVGRNSSVGRVGDFPTSNHVTNKPLAHRSCDQQTPCQVTQSEQELALCKNMTDTSLQTILAERVYDLIIELTALRAKISELREEHSHLVRDGGGCYNLEHYSLLSVSWC